MKTLVVDLSHWNTVTDMKALSAAGIVGVIHKATEGTGSHDSTYGSRRKQAEAAHLEWGAYHFLRPGDIEGQARFFVDTAKPEDFTVMAADHEDPGVSLKDLKKFLRVVTEETGRTPILYSGNVIKQQLGKTHDAELARYPLWLAHYTTGTPVWPQATWPTWGLWQYTDKGTIAGIDGDVDLNKYDGSANELLHKWRYAGIILATPTV